MTGDVILLGNFYGPILHDGWTGLIRGPFTIVSRIHVCVADILETEDFGSTIFLMTIKLSFLRISIWTKRDVIGRVWSFAYCFWNSIP